MPLDMMEDVANLRAANRMSGLQKPRSVELTIAEIRQLPGMRDLAEDQMVYFRDIIPALAAAPSAQPPGLHGIAPQQPQVEVQAVHLNDAAAANGHAGIVRHADNLEQPLATALAQGDVANSVSDMQGQGDQDQPSEEYLEVQAAFAEVRRQQAVATEALNYLRSEQEKQQAADILQQQQELARQQQEQQELARQQQEQLAARRAQQQAAALAEQRKQLLQAAAQLKATQDALQQQRNGQRQNASVLTHGQRYNAAAAPPAVNAPASSTQQYEYFVGDDGRMCRVPKTVTPHVSRVAPAPITQWEDRWSPLSGRKYQVQVPVPVTPAVGGQGVSVPQGGVSAPPQAAVRYHPFTG